IWQPAMGATCSPTVGCGAFRLASESTITNTNWRLSDTTKKRRRLCILVPFITPDSMRGGIFYWRRMMTTVSSRRVMNSATSAEPARKFNLSDLQTKGRNLPNRYVFYGVEGVGKTSFAAQTPRPVFVQSKGET